ncbi:MAG TPA: hypothetical protein VFU14_20025 [Acidimicrobiales bacterium]|nr:hypothetical protein [Acidimicrobiales bacterium]
MIPRPLRIAGIAVTVLVATACGGDDIGIFDEQVAEVRDAVEGGDRDAALAAIDDLAVFALAAHEEGEVDDTELQELAALIDHARAQVDAELPEPTTTTVTTTTTTTAPPPPPDEDDEDDEDDGHRGKGKKGKGEEDDD